MKKSGTITVLLLVAIVFLFGKKAKKKILVMKNDEQMSKDFKLSDLMKTSHDDPNLPNDDEKYNLSLLVKRVLQPIADLLKTKVVTNSGFRNEVVNKAAGGVSNSQHRTGFAVDFHTPNMKLMDAFKMIAKSSIPYDQLIFETNKNGGQWIHVSYSGKPRKALYLATWDNAKKKMVYESTLA